MPDFDLIADRKNSGSAKWDRYAKRNILPMWLADMDFTAAEPIIDSLIERAHHRIFGYTQSHIANETIVRYYARRWQCAIKEEWIVYLPGLGSGIQIATQLAQNLQGAVVLPNPIYPVFYQAVRTRSIPYLQIPLHTALPNPYFDLSYLEKNMPKNSVLMHICNPHNPGGKVFSKNELRDICETCQRHNMILCSDEVHADLILDQHLQHNPILSLDHPAATHSITLQSPSKAYNIAGLNFAFAIIPQPKIRRLFTKIAESMLPSHINPFGLTAGIAAWSGKCDAWLKKLVEYLRENRNILKQEIDSLDNIIMHPLPATYLAWLDVSRMNLKTPIRHFEQYGVGLAAGKLFGSSDHVRLNFACPRSVLQQAIACLRKAANA